LRGIPAAKPAGTSWVDELQSQLQIARAVKFLPAATPRQILIVHGSCKPAVKFYSSCNFNQLRSALIACQIFILIKLQLLSNFMRANQLEVLFFLYI
jgi:hypothetical protein